MVVAVGDERRQRVHVVGVLHHRDLVGLRGSEGEHVGGRKPKNPPPKKNTCRHQTSIVPSFGARLSPGTPGAALTKCAGDGERLSLSVAPAGTSSSGHFICRYCKKAGGHAAPQPRNIPQPSAGVTLTQGDTAGWWRRRCGGAWGCFSPCK